MTTDLKSGGHALPIGTPSTERLTAHMARLGLTPTDTVEDAKAMAALHRRRADAMDALVDRMEREGHTPLAPLNIAPDFDGADFMDAA